MRWVSSSHSLGEESETDEAKEMKNLLRVEFNIICFSFSLFFFIFIPSNYKNKGSTRDKFKSFEALYYTLFENDVEEYLRF